MDAGEPEADALRDQAREDWRAATQEARALFDETVACLLACGEVSESLDERWTALCEGTSAVAAE